jgi:hypothetical protein
MPLYQMTGKDGKVYRIEGPAGLPRETVMAEILKRAPQAGKPALATPDAALAAPTAVAPAQVAPEGEGGAQRGLFEQIGSSLKSGLIGLASIPQQAATQAFAGPVNAADQEREIFDAIDSGKYKPKFKSEEELKEARMTAAMVAGQAGAFGMGIPIAAGPDTELAIDEAAFRYYNANPRERAIMRGGVDKITENIAPRYERALQRVEEAEEEARPLRAQTTQVSDIDSWASFKNYLGGVIGETAAQLPITMASSAVAGPIGGLTAGTAISYGAETANRIAFAREKYKDLPLEKQATEIAKYLRDSGDVVAVSAAVQGALDLFGPVGTVLSRKVTSELGKEGTRDVLEAAAKRSFIESVKQEGKAAAKRFPREAGEEAVTGGAQEVTSILGERAIGEQTGPLLSAENLKRVFEASVAEGIGGGLVGTPTTFTTGVIGSRSETARAKRTLKQEAEEGRLKEFNATRGQLADAFETAVAKYKSEGMSEADALRKAGSDVQNYVAEQKKPAETKAAGTAGTAEQADEDIQQRPLASITGKQIQATIPAIEEAFEASALDFEDTYGVTELNPEQKKQAARIVLESPEIDPYDAIGSVIERGMQLRGEEVPSRVAAASSATVTGPANAQEIQDKLNTQIADINAKADEERAAIQSQFEADQQALAPEVKPTQAAPTQVAPTGPFDPSYDYIRNRPFSTTSEPEPEYTPQQIAENLTYFSRSEAKSRGYEPNTVPYGMFTEGARDVARGAEPMADEDILAMSGQEGLGPYKAGLQWAQNSVAAAQAAPAAAPEPTPVVAPTTVEASVPEAYAPILQEYQAIVEKPTLEAMDALKSATVREIPMQGSNMTMSVVQASDGALLALPGRDMIRGWQRQLQGERAKDLRSQTIDQFYDYEGLEVPLQVTRPAVVDASGTVIQRGILGKAPTTPKAPKGRMFENIRQPDTQETPEAEQANLTDEPRSTDIEAMLGPLPAGEQVNVRARLDRIMRQYRKDGLVARLLAGLEALRRDVDRRIYRNQLNRARPRVRGFERAMEVIYRAERNGQLSPRAAALARWVLERNPAIAEELAFSFRAGDQRSPAGQYNPIARLITIFASGANDGTAVHEILHHTERLMPEAVRDGIRAAWRKRIDDLLALAERTNNTEMRNVLGAIVQAYYGDQEAQRELNESFASGSIPYAVYHLSNPSEFWAVNATDLIGRRAERTGWVGAARTWLSDFIEAVKDFFGFPNNAAVIRGLQAILTAESGVTQGQMLAAEVTDFRNMASVKRLEKKLATADKAAELNRSAGALFFAARGSKEKIRLLNSVWTTLDAKRRRAALYMFYFNRDILRNVQKYSPPLARKLAELDNTFKMMTGARNKMLERLSYEANRWRKFNTKFKEGGRVLSMLLNASTSAEADPRYASLQEMADNDPKMQELVKKGASKRSLNNRLNTLKYVFDLYEQLADPKMGNGEGQSLYQMAISNFEKAFDAEHRTIIDNIRSSGLSAAAKKDTERRINDMYSKAKQLGPYSPLYRSGNFWVRIGKGKGRTTLRLDNETAWNFALQSAVEEIRQGGDTRSAEEIMADPSTITYGRDVDGLQADFFANEPSDVLKKVFDEIDKGGSADAKAIKDMVFQMYISSLPKGTTLERMQHRQGISGFSADVLRAYTDTQMAAINRLAQLQHARDMRNLVGEAYGMLEGNPDKNLLSPYVDEMAMRTAQAISPDAPPGSFIANLATKVSFLFLLTSVKSQLLQFFQLPFVGLPFLAERYGTAQTLALATRYMATFPRKFGTSKRDENGNVITEWGQPTIGDSAYVRKNKNKELGDALQFGWDDMMSRGLAGNTYSGDLFGRKSRPSEQYETRGARTSRAVWDFTTGGMHHIERMSREIMYMSAFELEFKKQRARGVDAKTAQVIAADTASELTQETMFDYAETSKPRMLKTVPGRIAFQFFTFPVQMASLLIRSFMGMVGLMPTRAERTAAAQKFFGVLGMTWMFAGTVGMPGYSFMMGVAQAIIDEMRPDDEEPGEEDDFNPLFSRNLDLWFREWFLPNYFGPDSDFAFYLNLSPEQAETAVRGIKMGPVSAATDVNFGSVGLDNMFFRDDTPTDTTQEAAKSLWWNMAGATGGVVELFTRGTDYALDGDWQRAAENFSPGFIKGSLIAKRLAEEGYVTPSTGDEVKAKEEYTLGKLLLQAGGFGSTEVVDVQKTNIMVKRTVDAIEKERGKFLDRLDKATLQLDRNPTNENAAKISAIWDEINKWEARTGHIHPISDENAAESIQTRAEARGTSMQGLRVPEKYDALVRDTLRSRE